MNLDADPQLEQVLFGQCTSSGHTGGEASATIADRCRRTERRYRYVLGGPWQRVRQGRVEEADGHTRRPEVFFDFVHAFAPTKALTDFEVELADFPHGGRGKEIRLTEHFSDGDWITTFFRYDAFERHYVDYLTSVP